jgi:hypothetical protein
MSLFFDIDDLVQVKSNLKMGKVVSFKRMVRPETDIIEDAYMVRHRTNVGIYFVEEIEGIHKIG